MTTHHFLSTWSSFLVGSVVVCGALLSCHLGYILGRHSKSTQVEGNTQRDRMETYQETLSVLTQDRVRLITPEQYSAAYHGELVMEMDILSADDIGRIRHAVDTFCTGRVPGWKEVRCHTILALTEAITNVIRHTPGGKFFLYLEEEGPCFHIQDYGPGIPVERLATVVFVNGFSTNNSLGAGFTIIRRYTRQMEFCTTENGTILVLRPDLSPDPKNPVVSDFREECYERGGKRCALLPCRI